MENVCGYKIKVIRHDYNDFLTELAKADLVLTPTRRLATRLNQDYAKLQALHHHPVWQMDIISLNGWVERLWQEQQDDVNACYPLRLNAWQTLIIWQSITDNNEQLARLALDAWTLLKEWDIDFESIDTHLASVDVQVFLQWCQQFKMLCQQENFIDCASMLQHIKIDRKNLSKVYLIGFTDIKPVMLKILKQLVNVEIAVLEFRACCESIHCAAQQDSKTELEQAALWAKQLLSQHPTLPIGVIIPDLSTRFNEVDDVFSRILMPQTLLANHYFDEKKYNISSGNKIAHFPIIAVIFDLFQGHNITRSPFINSDTRLTLNKEKCLAPSQWSGLIIEQLQIHGWPGQRVLNSVEYQVVRRFYELLAEYATLDLVQNKVSFTTAINHILQQANTLIFQGESENAPLQILGALEGEGLYFQDLWVTGLHQENWPASAKPHPFLPIALQRQHHMPHASHEREYLFSCHLTQRFTEQAHRVILSYPKMVEDKSLMPSHFIRDYPLLTQTFVEEQHERYDPCLILESWQEQNVPLKNTDVMLGGVGLLQSQSVCPFQAFARYRLKVTLPEQEENGLTFAERGELTHAALEYFWQQVTTSAQLHCLNNDALDELIDKSVQHALKQIVRALSLQHLTIEKARLKQLMHEWMIIEKQRSAFTVLHTEKNIDLTLAHIKLRARIDRIDQLASGDAILIDYKTGQVPMIDWLDERPTQLQLPIYALGYREASRLAIAKVKANEYQFKELEIEELSWDEMLHHWQNTLTQLALEFHQGRADVAPSQGEQSCRYCGLELLCRIRSA